MLNSLTGKSYTVKSYPWMTGLYYDDPPPVVDPPPVKTFTQADLDSKVAEARRKDQAAIKQQTDELKKLQGTVGATAQEKAELQQRIEAIEDQYKTAEQLRTQEAERKETKYKQDLESTATEREHWKKNFEDTTVSTSILRHASDAVSVEQIEDLLRPKSRVVPVKDADGKNVPGQYIVMVKIPITDAKTKLPVVMDIPVDEAVKQMKADVGRYGNLFKSTLTGGLGGSGGSGRPAPAVNGPLDGETIAKMTDAEYIELRKRNRLTRQQSNG